MVRIRFQASCRPFVRVTVGESWEARDYGLSFSLAYLKPRFERFTEGDYLGSFFAEAFGVCFWRMDYSAPQTVAERGAW